MRRGRRTSWYLQHSEPWKLVGPALLVQCLVDKLALSPPSKPRQCPLRLKLLQEMFSSTHEFQVSSCFLTGSPNTRRAMNDNRRICCTNALMNGSWGRKIARRFSVFVVLSLTIQSTILISVFELHLLQRRFDFLQQRRVSRQSDFLSKREK